MLGQIEYLKVDAITALGSMITILATVVGLVVWLVKQQTKRQNDVTDRYFRHLEERSSKNEKIHEGYAEAFKAVGESISTQTLEISKQTVQLGELTSKVGGLAESVVKSQCRAPEIVVPKPRRTRKEQP